MSRRSRWRAIFGGATLLAVSIAMSYAAPALAQEGLVEDATKQKAEQLRVQGNALSRQGKIAEAIEAYRAAFDLHPTAATASNLGALELTIKKHRDAAEHLSFALRRCGSECSQALQKALTERLVQAQAEVGKLFVVPSVEKAKVTVDGRFVAWVDPSEIYVEPGTHTVEAALSGYATARHVAEIKAGESQTIRLTLEPLAASDVLTSPSPSGAGAEGAVSTWKRRSTLVATGAGVVLAGVGLGIGFTMAANNDASQAAGLTAELRAKSGPTACSSAFPANAATCGYLQGMLYDHSTFTNVAGWLFLSAGAMAIATGLYALWPSAENDMARTSARLVPVVGPRENGLRLEAVF